LSLKRCFNHATVEPARRSDQPFRWITAPRRTNRPGPALGGGQKIGSGRAVMGDTGCEGGVPGQGSPDEDGRLVHENEGLRSTRMATFHLWCVGLQSPASAAAYAEDVQRGSYALSG
jgi:hypothetical protein